MSTVRQDFDAYERLDDHLADEPEWSVGRGKILRNAQKRLKAKILRRFVELTRQRDNLLTLSRELDEHPEGYDGPCWCKLCLSYADCEGLDFDRTEE